MKRIPIVDAPHQKFTVSLDKQSYQFMLWYNSREDRWYLSLTDAAGALIVSGIKLVVGNELIRQYDAYATPPGGLYVISTHSPYVEPTRAAFEDDRYELVYVTEEEWDAGVRP